MTIAATDNFIVQRGDTLYKTESQNLMATIQDTDLMYIQRGDTPYKVDGATLKEDLGGGGSAGIQPGINDITISPTVPGSGTEADPFILSQVRCGPYGSSAQTAETLTIDGQAANADVVWVDNSPAASGNRFDQPESTTDSSGVWTGKLIYNDTPSSTDPTTYYGNLQIGSLYFSWDINQVASATDPPVLGAVSLVEDDPNSDPRFTSSTFTVAATIEDEGVPTCDKQLKAYVEGSLQKQVQTSEITSVTDVEVDGNWTQADLLPSLQYAWTSVAYGNGMFVATNSNATGNPVTRMGYSSDGINWTGINVEEFATTAMWMDVAYGNGRFVAINANGTGFRAITSTNGIDWAGIASFPSTLSYQSIAAGDNSWCCTTSTVNGKLVYCPSADPTQAWQQKVMPNTEDNFNTITFGDGKYVTVAWQTSSYQCMWANESDLSGWNTVVMPNADGQRGSWRCVRYGNNQFVAVSSNGCRVAYTPSGAMFPDWKAAESNPTDYQYNTVTYGDGKWVALSQNETTGGSMWSTDGINWTSGDINGTAGNWVGSAYGGGKFVGVCNGGIMYSTTGTGSNVTNTVLGLTDSTDLTLFNPGDQVEQNEPVTVQGDSYTSVSYTGAGDPTTVTTGMNLSASKGLLWIKGTSQSTNHILVDNLRGATESLSTNKADAELSSNVLVKSFTSDGFIGGGDDDVSKGNVVYSAYSFMAAPEYFDVVTWEQTVDSGMVRVNHNLQKQPGFITVKQTTPGGAWFTWHPILNNNMALKLNTSDQQQTYGNTIWSINDQYFEYNASNINAQGDLVAYLWAQDTDYVLTGSYTGDSSTINIECGFEPGLVLIKCVTSQEDWYLFDKNNGQAGNSISPNTTGQYKNIPGFSFYNSGFTVVGPAGEINYQSRVYAYMAISNTALASVGILPQGNVVSADANAATLTVNSTTSGWSANTGNYAKGTSLVDTTKLYTKLNPNGTVASLVGDDPGYTTMVGNPPFTLTFPAQFPTGTDPDTELPEGTSLTADVRLSNVAGFDEETTNSVVPMGDPTIANQFATTLYNYDENGVTVTNGIDLTGNNNGMVWLKGIENDGSVKHCLYDTRRGANWRLTLPDQDSQTQPAQHCIFKSNGFDITDNGSAANYPGTSDYVSYEFKAAPKFFDVQLYTGVASAQVIPHDLDCQPGLIITKNIDEDNTEWITYSSMGSGLQEGGYLKWNDRAGPTASTTVWNNTLPTTTAFTVGNTNLVNKPDTNFVAYLFAENEENIKVDVVNTAPGTVTVNVGFKPQWVMMKMTASGDEWMVFDNQRGFQNEPSYTKVIFPSTTSAQQSYPYVWTTDTGFAMDGSSLGNHQYMYVAIKEAPQGLFSADDPTELAQFNSIKAKMDAYEGTVDARRATIVADLAAAGYTLGDIFCYYHEH